jgi:hypothetical protein
MARCIAPAFRLELWPGAMFLARGPLGATIFPEVIPPHDCGKRHGGLFHSTTAAGRPGLRG